MTHLGGPDATLFAARLSGKSQLVRDSNGNHSLVVSGAKGTAAFRLDETGTELRVVLRVRRMQNVTRAHLHLGFPDQEGSTVATLFDSAVPVGSGRLAVKTLTESDLTGPLTGDFQELVEALRNGEIYVDVHSTDFPAGEIRGQVGAK